MNDISEIYALDFLFQGFNWESAKNKKGWYNVMAKLGEDVKAAGFTDVWLPPPSQSVAPQGRSLDFNYVNLQQFSASETGWQNLPVVAHV